MVRFTVVPIASPLHEAAALQVVVDRFAPTLHRLGGEVADTAPDDGIEVSFVLTGGTETRLVERFRGPGSDPLLLLAHPDQNSLPAALEALARVQQLGGRGRIVYLASGDDRSGAADLDLAIRGIETRRAMAAMRLGLVGEPSDWLVASSPDHATVRQVWGPTVVPIPVQELVEGSASSTPSVNQMWEGATAVAVEPRRLRPAAAVHAALSDIISARRLDSVSVRCFDLIGPLDTTGCIALSRLNDDGVVAGCEGDLPSTLAMIWVRRLVDAPSWMANPARIDPGRGTVTLAHCTVPREMVVEYSLDSHFESGRGVGIAGYIPDGPCTLVRIGGTDLRKVWISDGMVVGSGNDPHLCRTQVDVEVGGSAIESLLRHPLGNHIVMATGHHAKALDEWWRLYVWPGT